MARLPIINGDPGEWGKVLNEYLKCVCSNVGGTYGDEGPGGYGSEFCGLNYHNDFPNVTTEGFTFIHTTEDRIYRLVANGEGDVGPNNEWKILLQGGGSSGGDGDGVVNGGSVNIDDSTLVLERTKNLGDVVINISDLIGGGGADYDWYLSPGSDAAHLPDAAGDHALPIWHGGAIGIGHNSPRAMLHVKGGGAGTGQWSTYIGPENGSTENTGGLMVEGYSIYTSAAGWEQATGIVSKKIPGMQRAIYGEVESGLDNKAVGANMINDATVYVAASLAGESDLAQDIGHFRAGVIGNALVDGVNINGNVIKHYGVVSDGDMFCRGIPYKAGGGSWVAPASDQRVKTNIKPLGNALEKINKLNGVSFNWKNPEEHSSQDKAGFIAQNIEEVFPHFIKEVPSSKQDAQLTGGKTKTYELPNEFTAYLVEAIKEQTKIIEELQARIAKLEGNA